MAAAAAAAGGHDPALARLVDQVLTAAHTGTPLEIRGAGTKRFYGGAPRGEPLELRPLAGITSHEPTELVVTARAGTPLAELEAALAEHEQCLPFEPPRFGGRTALGGAGDVDVTGTNGGPGDGAGDGIGGTVGGMVAAGLAGPSRAAVGGVRDFVLGVTVLNGRGELLSFGGQVMKNVAGYDVSRLMAGSMGVLGIVCEVSLKVLPRPAAQRTLDFELGEAAALDWLDRRRARPLPLQASAWHDGRLRIRLAGARAAVDSAAQALGGHAIGVEEAAAWWDAVRDQRHPFFEAGRPGDLWRLSLPLGTPALAMSAEPFIEWGGAQRWLRCSAPASELRAIAARAGGHATLFRGTDRTSGSFMPVDAPLMRIHREMKKAFDPAGVFNPGRLYPEL